MLEHEELTERIIGCAIRVHRELGPGLLESAYEACLAHELAKASIPFVRQAELPLVYDSVRLDSGYRIDLLVSDAAIVEVKSVDDIAPIHVAQLMTYLRLSRRRVGLLINFNVQVLHKGIVRRIV